MEVKVELNKFLDSCGGEDLIRWLLKDDGYRNWQSMSLMPIVAWSPPHMAEPLVVGVAVKGELDEEPNILVSTQEFPKNKEFNSWVQYLMERGEYVEPAEALLDHNRALIASEVDIMDAEMIGWKVVLQEVIDCERDNGVDGLRTPDEFDEEMIEEFTLLGGMIEFMMDTLGLGEEYRDFADSLEEVYTIQTEYSEDYSDAFKNEWV
mgnify:CR=1 FL=1|tara:strand:+ start:833 stop:1453 length:621 start_codon:yes stop_codon:yes gene_type:complete